MGVISVENLVKTYQIHHKEPGFLGSVSAFFNRKYKTLSAVNKISFDIGEGELVGFIGPNGAGKTTTLKCLTGLLYPTTGTTSILGFTPHQRKKEFLKQISLVMGQKNQLWWDLPAMESFILNKVMFEVPDKDFNETVDTLSTLLDVKDVLNVQVRKLSLGQRMKCEFIAALIHNPKILFLDEPTIGLDVIMQKKLREFIREYNERYKATILLTSHYMEDVKELCKRVIIIDHGKIIYDGNLDELSAKYTTHKLISIIFNKAVSKDIVSKLGTIDYYEPLKAVVSVPREKTNDIASKILRDFPVDDLNIEEVKIEDIISQVFSSGKHV